MGAVTHNGLRSMLETLVALPSNKVAAAALTVAFEIHKAQRQARGENPSDQIIIDEIRTIYNEMMGITDPTTQMARAQQKAQPQRRP